MGLRQWWTRFAGLPADPPPVEPAAAVPTEADLLAALDGVEASVAGGTVPGLVASRVRRVTGTVRQTVPRLRNLGLGSPEAYSVIATATDYLPEALAGYTRLPRQWADSRPVENGKTSLMLLVDQLDLLGSTMDQVLDAVVRVDAAALVAHGRFLQTRFGPRRTAAASTWVHPARVRATRWTYRDQHAYAATGPRHRPGRPGEGSSRRRAAGR